MHDIKTAIYQIRPNDSQMLTKFTTDPTIFTNPERTSRFFSLDLLTSRLVTGILSFDSKNGSFKCFCSDDQAAFPKLIDHFRYYVRQCPCCTLAHYLEHLREGFQRLLSLFEDHSNVNSIPLFLSRITRTTQTHICRMYATEIDAVSKATEDEQL